MDFTQNWKLSKKKGKTKKTVDIEIFDARREEYDIILVSYLIC